MLTAKICSSCKEEKLLSLFSKNKSTKDGFKYSCKVCISKYYLKNKDLEKQKRKLNYQQNKSQYIERAKIWKANNPEKVAADRKQWNNKNKFLKAYYTSTRRAIQTQATPSWANLKKIKQIFKDARTKSLETGIKYTVDHIIPLHGKLVSGLHVENNLRLLPYKENCKKGNKYVPT